MKGSAISIFDYQPKPTKDIRKSNKFKGAYLIKGYWNKAHFFLNDVKYKTDTEGIERACVEYVFYDNKWREDTYYFEVEEYKSIMRLLR